MAAHFANTLSVRENEEQCYTCGGSTTNVICAEISTFDQCTGYTLPYESEWELAKRSGTTKDFWTGNGEDLGGNMNLMGNILDGVDNPSIDEFSWNTQNSNGSSHPVGQLTPNGFGLYDMSGNVWEWVMDRYGGNRVKRGGSWYWLGESYLCEYQCIVENPSSHRSNDSGFRLRKRYMD